MKNFTKSFLFILLVAIFLCSSIFMGCKNPFMPEKPAEPGPDTEQQQPIINPTQKPEQTGPDFQSPGELKDNIINATIPVITQQPNDIIVTSKSTFKLEIEAETEDGGTLSYKWFKTTDTNSVGESVKEGQENTLDSSYELQEGENEKVFYYYVIVTNTNTNVNGNTTASKTSSFAKVTVNNKTNAQIPSITEEPEGYSGKENPPYNLTLQASVTDGGTLTYQWYKASTINEVGTPIDNETSSTYTIKSLNAGDTFYYYCVVTNTIPEGDDVGVAVQSVTSKRVCFSIFGKLGYNHPSASDSDPYRPVDLNGPSAAGYYWKFQSEPGATIDNEGNAIFTVYSKNASKILLEIYDSAYGKDAIHDYWMEKGADDFWRAKLADVPNGTYYAFRAWGPNWEFVDTWERGNSDKGFKKDYDTKGNRFNPNKVLFDPYAKEISHDKSNPTALGSMDGTIYATGEKNSIDGNASRYFDTGKYAPKSVLVVDNTSTGTKPNIPQEKAIIYEAHARGITKHESSASLKTILAGIDGFDEVDNIPPQYQGTYKGAGMLAPYLKALGVNTIELLPVHESDNDCNPDDNPGGNYWAYMTYGYFAPDRRYSYDKDPGGPTKEFKEMVAAFHEAGMEVYLDVVFNHSGEGGPWYGKEDSYNTAELTFMRGLDCSEYYALTPNEVGDHWQTTGCGNNLRCDSPVVRKLILDSLTYWIDEMGVDGYRFDLAPVIGREFVNNTSGWLYNKNAQILKDIVTLGNNKNAEMIAEAWDCHGSDGYHVGNFPYGWGEWNGRYRDAIRSYVGTGNWGSVGDFINGDYNNFNDQGGSEKSVNFIVAHDGFTLADLCSYEGAGNAQNSKLAWPFGPSDGGNGDKNSLGFGTTQSAKRQANRNYIAIQMMSRGVPMIVWGDEFSRTQNGNNNPYNIDSVATWSNYNMINTDSPHTVPTGGQGSYHDNFGTFDNLDEVNGNFMFMKYMLNLKKTEPALNQKGYTVPYNFSSPNSYSGATMIHIDGSTVSGGSDYLLCMNMTGGEVSFTLPSAASGKSWVRIVDTQKFFENDFNCWNADSIESMPIEGSYGVTSWSVVIFKEVAKRENVANPIFTPSDTNFEGSVDVTISCATNGAKIYYTLDGTIPSETNGTEYTGSFNITTSTTIRAIAVKAGAYPSDIVNKRYVNSLVVENPVLSVPKGDFWNTITVFVSTNTKDANIYYTTNGTEPTTSSTKYTSAGIKIDSNTTLKVIATKSGLEDSEVISATYTKQTDKTYTENKSGVILQGFNWDSAPRGDGYNAANPHPKWGRWYKTMLKYSNDIKDNFEYVWFPPPSKTDTSSSEGYAPTELNDLNSCYGTEEELSEVISAISPETKAIADIVVNHRAGTTSWGDFTNPKWNDDYYSICSDDEGFSSSGSPMYGSSNKGAADTGDKYKAYRDLDHTNTTVQQGIYSWMNSVLKRVGFVGWRYDYVRGFDGKYVGYYNAMSNAAFSVGENWPDGGEDWKNKISSWINATGNTVNGVTGKQSRAFDFVLKQNLNNAFGWTKAGDDSNDNLWNLSLLADDSTLMRSNPSAAITFIDNHDTGSTQKEWELSWFDVPAAYAYILTHPGMPCVASQHYFSENGDQYRGSEIVHGGTKTMKEHIDYLIDLRKSVGIEYDDSVTVLASSETNYAAQITGTKGEIVVKIGGDMWSPTGEGYEGNYPIYSGTNFEIWQKGNKGVAPAPVDLTISAPDWIWSDNAVLYAWVWGGEYGEGQWVKATGSGTTINLTIKNDAKGFLFARCSQGTTTPDWAIRSGDAAGRIYNQTGDVNFVKGQTEYSVDFTEYPVTRIIYLSSGVWNSDGAWFVAWNWSNDTDGEWVKFNSIDEYGTYEAKIDPAKKNIKFLRMNSSADKNSTEKWWESFWNETGDLTIPDDSNTYYIKDWDNYDWYN